MQKGRMNRQQSKIGQNNNGNENDAISLRSKKSNRIKAADSMIGGNYSGNDRFYEEYEYERRLRKRRARLLTTTEDAFTHIKRFHDHLQSNNNFESNIYIKYFLVVLIIL